MKNLNVALAFLLLICSSLLMTACNGKGAKEQDSVKRNQVVLVDAEQFRELLTDTTTQLVDVRTVAEYAEGHIGNAMQLPVNEADFLEKALQRLDKKKAVLLYCRSGRRSAKAANILIHNGFERVYDLAGGYKEYPYK